MKKIFLIITAMLALSFSSKADNLRILAEAGDEATLTAAIAQFEEANSVLLLKQVISDGMISCLLLNLKWQIMIHQI